MATGLIKNWREHGCLVVEIEDLGAADKDCEEFLGIPIGQPMFSAHFVGWGRSYVGLATSKNEALRFLEECSGIHNYIVRI